MIYIMIICDWSADGVMVNAPKQEQGHTCEILTHIKTSLSVQQQRCFFSFHEANIMPQRSLILRLPLGWVTYEWTRC